LLTPKGSITDAVITRFSFASEREFRQMPLNIEFVDGDRAGEVLTFSDDVEVITIGRDPSKCQIVLPPDMLMVGREHCTVSRVRGHYYLQMGADRRVSMDGQLMETSQRLPVQSDLQLGPEGPVIRIKATRSGRLATTMNQDIDFETLAQRTSAPASKTEVDAVQAQAKAGTRTATIAVSIAIIVMILGAVVFIVIRRDVSDVELTQADASQSVEKLAGQVEDMERDVTSLGADLPAMLEAASASTYIVIRINESGLEEPFGTAFLVQPGQLATNAHVAQRFSQLRKGEKIIVRGRGGEIQADVTGVRVHPGFNEFADLWQSYVPVQINASSDDDPIKAAGMATDVGLLLVDQDSDLGTPLTLASTAEQADVHAGQTVGYVGYPVEDLALGGVNLATPVPQIQMGRITALTNYFNAPDADGGLLIQHSLPATGGASGSPLLDTHGHVIGLLSGVNFIVVGGHRIPNGADVNFAQRASLITELESPQLESVQTARTQRWQHHITTLYESGHLQSRSPEIADIVDGWEQMIAADSGEQVVTGSSIVSEDLFQLDSVHINPLAMGAGDALGLEMYGKQLEFDVKAGQDYLLTVEGKGNVIAQIDEGSGTVTRIDVMSIKPMLKAIAFRAKRDGTVKAIVGSSEPTGAVSYQLRQAAVERATPKSVARAAMRRWIRDLNRRDGTTYQGQLVHQAEASLTPIPSGEMQYTRTFSMELGGPCLIMAANKAFEDIGLAAWAGNTQIAAIPPVDWYPFAAFDSQQAQKVLVTVTGTPEQPSMIQIFLYQAQPRGRITSSQ
jgi:hypothetical protein